MPNELVFADFTPPPRHAGNAQQRLAVQVREHVPGNLHTRRVEAYTGGLRTIQTLEFSLCQLLFDRQKVLKTKLLLISLAIFAAFLHPSDGYRTRRLFHFFKRYKNILNKNITGEIEQFDRRSFVRIAAF